MSDERDEPNQKSNQKSDVSLVEGRDYTLEQGLFVLTRDYLLRRGHCCGSGCRNCPYPVEGSPKIFSKDKLKK